MGRALASPGPRRRVAALLPLLALVACTNSNGPTPPAPVGSFDAPAPALNSGGAQPPAAVVQSEPTPAFSGPEPSKSAAFDQNVALAHEATASDGKLAAATLTSPIQFAPVTGATPEAVAPLSDGLLARAKQRGVLLAGSGIQPAYIVKGYLSEVVDSGATTVIYVWDVTDAGGRRLHRIQGRATSQGGSGWSSVSPQAMKAIADHTIDELARWLSARPG